MNETHGDGVPPSDAMQLLPDLHRVGEGTWNTEELTKAGGSRRNACMKESDCG